MRRVVSIGWLLASIVGAVTSSASAERFDTYFLSESRLPEIAAVGIGPSSDAWKIYGEFTKQFVHFSTAGNQNGAPDIRRIMEDGGGDANALAFLLLNLFRWNGIDAELALVSTKRGTKLGDRYVERVLVYVPALGQYFDPMRSPATQPRSSDRTWLEGRRRIHFAIALRHSGKLIGRCSDSCLYAYGENINDATPLPYAVRVKPVRVPAAESPN